MADEQGRLVAPAENELPWAIEALLFVAEEPPTAPALARALGASPGAIRRALKMLAADYEARGLRLQEVDGSYQLVTAPEYAVYVETFLGTSSQKLSRAALEVLSIIAYRQPCTRADVEAIRGVNSDKLVTTLEQRGLVESPGTGEGPGRPHLFRVTSRFYEHFGICSTDELPPLPEPATADAEQVEVQL